MIGGRPALPPEPQPPTQLQSTVCQILSILHYQVRQAEAEYFCQRRGALRCCSANDHLMLALLLSV